MTKGTKIALIVAAAAIVFGLVFMSLTYNLVTGGHWKEFSAPGRSGYERREFTADAAKVLRIDAADENNAVRIVAGDADTIRVAYSVSEYDTYEISLEADGTLKVRYKLLAAWIDRIGFVTYTNRQPLEIAIPESSALALDLSTSNAQISAAGLTVGSLSADTGNGSIDLDQLIVTGELEAETSNSSLHLTSIRAGSIDAETSNGRLAARGLYADGGIDLETSNAALLAENIKTGTGNIELTSSNGSVTAKIDEPTDTFTIRAEISNGKSNLPSNWGKGAKQLEVRTSNADISVTFAD